MRRLQFALAVVAATTALQAAGQAAPGANFTDMWWAGPQEDGWGLSFVQHSPSNKAFAVWYTYDPRAPDTTTAATTDFVPLWFAMPDCRWTTPLACSGELYVTIGSPYGAAWNPAVHDAKPVGTYAFNFTGANSGAFTYSVVVPAGLPSTDPRFGLPAFAGVKTITRQPF